MRLLIILAIIITLSMAATILFPTYLTTFIMAQNVSIYFNPPHLESFCSYDINNQNKIVDCNHIYNELEKVRANESSNK